MASAFGGQRSIQLSYGCLCGGIASEIIPRNLKMRLGKKLVCKFKRIH